MHKGLARPRKVSLHHVLCVCVFASAYIDFRPGGKYGPPGIDVGATRDKLTGVAFAETTDMKRATQVYFIYSQKKKLYYFAWCA